MKNIGIEREAYFKYLEANGDFENIYLKALQFGVTPQVFLEYVKNYLNKFDIKTKCDDIFDTFIQTVSEEKNILIFLNSKLSISELEKNFAIYITKYYYNKDEFDNFEELIFKFKKCIRSLNRELGKKKVKESKNISSSYNNNDTRFIYASKIIKKFANSKYSRERFILQNKLNYRDFMALLAIVEKGNYEVYEAYKRKMENDKLYAKEKMTEDILKLLNLINLKKGKLSLIEFFATTNYGFKELKQHVDEILNPNDAKCFRMNLTYLNNCDVYDSAKITSLFDETFTMTIYNIPLTIDEDTKSIAIEFLLKNDIPVSAQTFSEAIILNLTNHFNNQTKTRK